MYRLVFINEESLEERYSIKVNRLAVISAISLIGVVVLVLAILLVAFSPLKEYIPGYASDYAVKQQVVLLSEKVDSLEKAAYASQQFVDEIVAIVSGKKIVQNLTPKAAPAANAVEQLRLEPAQKEKEFRARVEKNARYTLTQGASARTIQVQYFYPPLKGKITEAFNPLSKHFGVDVVSGKDESVKATLDGTVIFTGWTPENGHVIHIQHEGNIVSVYKHNAALLRKEGDRVKAGDVVAITGNSGEITTGPHLHFELWIDGNPADPQSFIVF